LEFNKLSIIKNLLALEEHLQRGGKQHLGCALKHSLYVEHHCDEAISHSSKVDKSLIPTFTSIRREIIELRKDFGKKDIEDLLLKTREIRKKFCEKFEEYSWKGCCKEVEEFLGKKLNYLSKKLLKIRMITAKQVLEVGVGSFLGKGIQEVARTYLVGTIFGMPISRVANLTVGAALPILSIYNIIPAKWQLMATVAGFYLLATELVDFAMEKLVIAAIRVAPPVPVASPTPSPKAAVKVGRKYL